MRPYAQGRKTGTCHTDKTVERERERKLGRETGSEEKNTVW